ncbi:hypothetical protein AOCH_001835 [Aspergillus ochraceoroseus]|uniref:Rieske domain-containing protein n=2 Tax=Aspergillus ochraceoroseus TaxID=138278 RepID=A0A0F8VPP4_9EURO|nr:hypothetical protein AOCH_001835 [Aspergillus ochraceoroseus]
MRLHLTIQRHGLPVTRILWTTSPPSLFGHNLPSPSSLIPAASSAITSSRVPNALYSNEGYTVAQLLEDVNEVIPLETEPRLFDHESSGQWGLEDYVVEVGGSECLHFMEVQGLLRDGDEVLIRALQISDLRARRLSGRHQISTDGKHLIDGVPFGKPFLKRPTASRPAIAIPPRKKRRATLALWGNRSNYEEEDTEWAPTHIGSQKELSILKPEAELGDAYENAYQDDYEDYHEQDDGDGTVIRHTIDQASETDEGSDLEVEDLTQELQDLKKDMDIPVVPELEKAHVEETVPRKSSIARHFATRLSDGALSRRDSKVVRFDQEKQHEPSATKAEASTVVCESTSKKSAHSISSPSNSSSSVSDSSESDSQYDSSSDESDAESDSVSSESDSESSSESEEESTSDSSSSESEDEFEDFNATSAVQKLATKVNPPGEGSLRTKKSNQRTKLRRRLAKLKELGILGKQADFASLRKWEEEHGNSFYIPETRAAIKKQEQEEFEAKRQKLLRELESGGIDISAISEQENLTPEVDFENTLGQPEDEVYETANDATEISPQVEHRRTLDVASTRRLLFGSLGVRTPCSKEEEEATRKKLAGKAQKFVPPQAAPEDTVEHVEGELEVDWRDKLTLGATECLYDDIELSTPPFPFEQHWDAEAGNIIRQRNGRNRKRKRRQQLQVYEEEYNEGESYLEDSMQLNYDDVEEPAAAQTNGKESEDALPPLPSDPSALPNLTGSEAKPGLVFAFKQLDVSKATNWQPVVSEYRVAVISEVFNDNILSIQLAEPYRRQPKDTDEEEGPFQYSGFEMPGFDDQGEDDGFREVPFDDLIDPKLLRAAQADNGGEMNATNSPAVEEPIDPTAVGGGREDQQLLGGPIQRPSCPECASNVLDKDASPIRSPQFEGFDFVPNGSNPSSNATSTSITSPKAEMPENSSPKEEKERSLSTCPPNAVKPNDNSGSGLTDQLQAPSSPSSIVSLHRLLNEFIGRHPSPPVNETTSISSVNQRESSPARPSSQESIVPNPFYKIDKAHEERQREAQGSSHSGLRQPSSSSRPHKSTKADRESPSSAQDTSLANMVQGSIRQETKGEVLEPQGPSAPQMSDFIVDLTQSSPLVSPSGSDEDYAKSHRLARGSATKNIPSTRRKTRQSSSQTGMHKRQGTQATVSPLRKSRRRKSYGAASHPYLSHLHCHFPPSRRRLFPPATMAQEYKLKDITSLGGIKGLEKVECEVEGVQDGKVLLVKSDGKVHAISPRCTHYGAPLKLGVVSPEGRITCPWHGACFNITTGDVEDAPAPAALNTFELVERDGAVYIIGEEAAIKAGQRPTDIQCSADGGGGLVIVGGGSGALGVLLSIRDLKYQGPITLITREPNLIIDRPKLSKALIPDAEKLLLRPAHWYRDAGIETVTDEVTSVDFAQKTVATRSGKSYPYTKLVLATGGVPRTLPLEGFQVLENIFTLRTVADVQDILAAIGTNKQKRIVVIGSSFIGMEVGNALAKDNHVTIVGQEQAPLQRVMGLDVGRIFQRNLETAAGVTFRLAAPAVARATPSPDDPRKVGAVHLRDGTLLPADLVILGVGVRPATDYLHGNPAVSLELDGSIRTNEHFAVPGLHDDVFAVGDIATYPYHGPGAAPHTGSLVRIEHWNVAQNAGRAVSRAIVHTLNRSSSSSSLQTLKPKTFIPVFWSALGAQLRYCGSTANGWDDVLLQGEPDNAKFVAYYCRGETVVAVATMGMDPVMVKSAELMRKHNMLTKTQIQSGCDVLSVGVF